MPKVDNMKKNMREKNKLGHENVLFLINPALLVESAVMKFCCVYVREIGEQSEMAESEAEEITEQLR